MARFIVICTTTFTLLILSLLTAPSVYAASTTNCFTHLDPASDFTSQDSAAALRQAVIAASPGNTIKIAGSCVGAISESGAVQVAVISKTLTLRGGYTNTNWLTSNPVANPTILDAQNGGRVLNVTAAGVTIENLTLTGGNSNGSGGALLANQSITLNNVNVVSNTATTSGGGIAVNGSGISHIVGGRFERNRAANSGGGINIAGTLYMTQSQVLSNVTSSGAGGGTYVGNAVRLSDVLFQGNQANGNTGNGGGLLVAGTSNNSFNNVDFISNQAGAQGGGAHLSAATQIIGGSLIDNRATSSGGGIATLQRLSLNNSRLIGNFAQLDGGAIYYGYFSASNSVNHQLVNTLLARNTGGRNGAAVYVALSGNSLEIVHTTIATPTAASGAAIYLNAGSVRITNTLFANYNTAIQRLGGSASEEYNLFFAILTPTLGTVLTSTHRITGDPFFVNPTTDDYHVRVGSAAVNQALEKGITSDIDGDTRPFSSAAEIGYDEFIESPIIGLSLTALPNPTHLDDATTLQASLSAGDYVQYVLDLGDGTVRATAQFLPGQVIVVHHSYAAIGSYSAILTATNTHGSVIKSVTVQVINNAPQADAGNNLNAPVESLLQLNGLGSTDSDGDLPLRYGWLQTSGEAVTLNFADTANSTFIAPTTPGNFTFALMVTDSHDLPAVAADEVMVHVRDVAIQGLTAQNSAPTRLGQSTLFTATRAAGSNVLHTWNFGDGTPATSHQSPVTSHTYTAAGLYTAIITATNSESTVSETMTVQVVNDPPQADAGVDQETWVGSSVILNGAASSDPNGNIPLAYGWMQTGGTSVTLDTPTAAQPSFSAPATPGVLTFTLMVTDSQGMPALATDEVVVQVRDQAITNLALQSSAPTLLSQATDFTATQSSGSNILYTWDFGDGTTENNQQSTINNHVYADPGIYTAIVTASNSAGSQVATIALSVINLAPNAEEDSYLLSEDQSLVIATAGVMGNDWDANQQPLQSEVSQPPAHGVLRLNLDGSFVYTPQVNYYGNDSFVYKVRDTGALTDTAAVTLTVQSVNDAPVAASQAISTSANQPVTLTLSGADVDGDILGFAILIQPHQGTLSGTLPNLTYSPAITASGVDSFTFQACDNAAPVLCAQATVNFSITALISNLPPILLSTQQNGVIGNLAYRDEDILRYDRRNNRWTILFDGSNLGLDYWDVDAFAMQPDGSILMSFDAPTILPTLGWVNDNNIVKFIPTSLGYNNTRGRFEWFLKGKQVGLRTGDEDIDAIDFDPNGRLLISVIGNLKLPGQHGKDEDLFALNNGVFGAQSSGTWSSYFKGSLVGLNQERSDLLDTWSDPNNGELYLTSKQSFTAQSGLVVSPGDIAICALNGYGEQTNCTFRSFWKGSQHGLGNNIIDGLHVGEPPIFSQLLSSQLVNGASLLEGSEEMIVDEIETNEQVEPAENEEDTTDEDATDAEEDNTIIQQFFLPMMER